MSLHHSADYLAAVAAERHRTAQGTRTARAVRSAAFGTPRAAHGPRPVTRLAAPLRRLLHASQGT